MTPFRPGLLVLATFSALGALQPAAMVRADDVKVQELRTQRIGTTTYFQVRFEQPANYRPPELPNNNRWWEDSRHNLARLPRLVPQDKAACCVYLRMGFPTINQIPLPKGEPLNGDPQLDGLDFMGKVEGKGEAKLLLLYPTERSAAKDGKTEKESELAKLLRQRSSWAEVQVTLDFSKAVKVDPPTVNRKADEWPAEGDLEGRWAAAQAATFAVLEVQSPDFGFFSFARESTGRKYLVPAPSIRPNWTNGNDRDLISRRLYELTTGAAAIAESMALNRLRNGNFRDKGERTVDITKLRGIDIAEHPWQKMMAGQKPSPEPLAKLVPHDNYYLHFKSIVKFLEAGDLMDQWGTTLSRAFEVNSHDHLLKERLHQQLCLKNTGLARVFGPAVIKGMAVTGSDPYVREGSDVTVIFHLINKQLFQNTVDSYVQEARKKFGKDLRKSKDDFHKITVESYVTPLREVSLHRAFFDDYAVYGNSLVGVQRVLETYAGKRKALTESLDYQYMRTVFRLEDKNEDGFLFISDAFLRNLVGPATRIKERRRLEALTSLYMVTHGAIYTSWQTGQPAMHHNDVLAHSGLKAEELFAPDGAGAFWDGDRGRAVSAVYNTIQFATPLIELAITNVTPTEQQEYEQFRLQYLGLWRQFFDPIGGRLAVNAKQARFELFILPLVQSTQYKDLRNLAGEGSITIDPATKFGPPTLGQLVMHLSPNADQRKDLARYLRAFARDIPGTDWLGSWVTVRLDDSDVYRKLAEVMVQRELDPSRNNRSWQEESRLLFKMPLTVGVEIRNKLVFAGVLATAKKALQDVLPGQIDWTPMKPDYKGVGIVKIEAKGGLIDDLTGAEKGQDSFTPALYYAMMDDGWYVSLSEAPIKELIDCWDARKKGKGVQPSGEKEKVTVNSSLYVAPGSAVKAKDFLRFYLEWESHKRAKTNAGLLEALYRGGLLTADAGPAKVQQVAVQYLGFVPVSPDGAPYTYDPQRQEVVNQRHGSLRKPRLHEGIESDTALGRLLEEFRTIRADLRFREDGINTVITFDRNSAK